MRFFFSFPSEDDEDIEAEQCDIFFFFLFQGLPECLDLYNLSLVDESSIIK